MVDFVDEIEDLAGSNRPSDRMEPDDFVDEIPSA